MDIMISRQEKVRSEEYARFLICKTMGWDLYTYESQPPYFIDQIMIFLNMEAQASKLENNKHGRR